MFCRAEKMSRFESLSVGKVLESRSAATLIPGMDLIIERVGKLSGVRRINLTSALASPGSPIS
jgi:hypothetical protein